MEEEEEESEEEDESDLGMALMCPILVSRVPVCPLSPVARAISPQN